MLFYVPDIGDVLPILTLRSRRDIHALTGSLQETINVQQALEC
jgi:hypothetical protein